MSTNFAPLISGTFYHIYNRGNNHDNIFVQERNYAYFLKLWSEHINPIAETWAYCLLRNHFHTAVYIKDQGGLTGLKAPHQSFSNFFNAYARGVNRAAHRTGALFERPFKRIPIHSTSYLMQLVIYIHQNPQKHTFVDDFCQWSYSSYHELIGHSPTWLQREGVLQLFGSREDFVRIHHETQPLANLTGVKDLSGLVTFDT